MNRFGRSMGLELSEDDPLKGINFDELPQIDTTYGQIKITLSLIAKFYETLPYDNANTQINEILNNYIHNNLITYNGVQFQYKIDWEEADDAFFEPENDWLIDVIDTTDPSANDYIESEDIRSVMGLRIRLYPNENEIILSKILYEGYELINNMINKLSRDIVISTQTVNMIVGIIATKETNEIIYSKLNDEIEEEDIKDHISIDKILKNYTLIKLNLIDRLTLRVIINALEKKEGLIRKIQRRLS